MAFRLGTQRGWLWFGGGLLLVGAAGLIVAGVQRHNEAAAREAELRQESQVAERAAAGAYYLYGRSAELARQLEAELARFADAPTQAGLERVRALWVEAREPYQRTEAFRFWNGPIDAVETWINTWPVDEEVLEAADGEHGLLDVAAPPLTPASLRELNLRQGETSVITGWHAIEFVLWGKDTSLDGPGSRSVEAFLASDRRAARRLEFLRASSRLLVQQLEELEAAWAPGRDNFRRRFLGLPPAVAVARLVRGFGSMAAGELAGERITVALLTRDPENEHSCFSDTTSADLAADAAGLEALCSGVFQSGQTIGVGLCSLGEPELARRVKAALELTRTLPRPFDKALALPDESAERVRMFAVRDAWQAIGRDAAQLLDGIEAAP